MLSARLSSAADAAAECSPGTAGSGKAVARLAAAALLRRQTKNTTSDAAARRTALLLLGSNRAASAEVTGLRGPIPSFRGRIKQPPCRRFLLPQHRQQCVEVERDENVVDLRRDGLQHRARKRRGDERRRAAASPRRAARVRPLSPYPKRRGCPQQERDPASRQHNGSAQERLSRLSKPPSPRAGRGTDFPSDLEARTRPASSSPSEGRTRVPQPASPPPRPQCPPTSCATRVPSGASRTSPRPPTPQCRLAEGSTDPQWGDSFGHKGSPTVEETAVCVSRFQRTEADRDEPCEGGELRGPRPARGEPQRRGEACRW